MDNFSFSIGIFEFSIAYILLFIGFLASIWIAIRTIHEKQLSLQFLNDHLLSYVLGSLFVGRLGVFIEIYNSIEEKMFYSTNVFEKFWVLLTSFLSFWQGGFDIFWALIGFLLLFLFFCSLKNEHPLAWMDAFSLPILVFFIFFSVASFFAGWRYGTPIDETYWFGVEYDLIEVLYSTTLHPVQIYSAIGFGVLFGGGIFLWARKIKHAWPSGIFGGLVLSSSFFLNAFLEFFRGEVSTKIFGFMPVSALLSFSFALTILIFMIWRGHFNVFSRFKSIITD